MAEPLEIDPFDGRIIYSFDGRVLEIFGPVSLAGARADACRIHVRQLAVKMSAPDKDGARGVTFVGPITQQFVRVPEEKWTRLQPLLDALQTAGADVLES